MAQPNNQKHRLASRISSEAKFPGRWVISHTVETFGGESQCPCFAKEILLSNTLQFTFLAHTALCVLPKLGSQPVSSEAKGFYVTPSPAHRTLRFERGHRDLCVLTARAVAHWRWQKDGRSCSNEETKQINELRTCVVKKMDWRSGFEWTYTRNRHFRVSLRVH